MTEKLKKKLKSYNKNKKVLSKTQERKAKRKVQHLRREIRKQHEIANAKHDAWVEEYMEQQRIIREVEAQQEELGNTI